MPNTDAERAQRRTIALFVASAVLATVGVALLLGLHGEEPPAATAKTPTTSAPSADVLPPGRTGPSPASSSPEAKPSKASRPAVASPPSPVPAPMQMAARAFTIAWVSHDARPGRDTSLDDASQRAAAFAGGELAKDLRAHTSGGAGGQQWLSWKERQVQVTVTVLRVSLPDGAPVPTRKSGFARVLYKATETPARGAPTHSEQHVALKLRRSGDGIWRVVGLPNV